MTGLYSEDDVSRLVRKAEQRGRDANVNHTGLNHNGVNHNGSHGPIPTEQVAEALADRTAVAGGPQLPDEVWTGWFSHWRSWVEPSSDMPLEAIYAGGMTALGIALGRNVAVYGGRNLFANSYGLIVGPPGRTRKSTLIDRLKKVVNTAFVGDDGSPFLRITGTAASGPGLLEGFCGPPDEGGLLRGIPGLRLLLTIDEFSALLLRLQQPATSSIREELMELYYGNPRDNPTRQRPILVEEPHLSVLGVSTPGSLEQRLLDSDLRTGFVPRFFVYYVNLRPVIPLPPQPDEERLRDVVHELQDIAQFSLQLRPKLASVPLSEAAHRTYEEAFQEFHRAGEDMPELAQYMVERVGEKVLTAALVYAMCAKHDQIEVDDLVPAIALGRHQLQVAPLIAGGAALPILSREQQRVLDALREVHPKWVTPSAVHEFVGGRMKAEGVLATLDSLVALRRVEERDPDDPEVEEYRRPGRPPRGYYRWLS